MKLVQETLRAHFEQTYFYKITRLQQSGSDTGYEERRKENLLTFLNAIPLSLSVEDGQYAIIERWIDMEIINNRFLARHMEISILTYINSCQKG